MKKIKAKTAIIALIVGVSALIPACASSPIEITELPIDYGRIEKIYIETPGRNFRTSTHVDVRTGTEGSAEGFIRDWSMNGSTLKIKLGGDFILTVPETADIRGIDIAIASGSILVEGFRELRSLRAASAEGDISFREIGSVRTVRADSTNGNLSLEIVEAGKVEANTISGDIEFIGTAERLTLSGLSGNMRVYTTTEAEVDFNSLTGRRNYSSTPGATMKIKASSLAGSLTVEKK